VKRGILLLSLILLVVASLLIGSCAQPAPAPKPSPAPAPGPTPATKPAPIVLKYADQNPEIGWEGAHAAVPWLKQIENATNGAVKVEGYFNQTLFKGTDAWEALKSNQADFAWCFHGYWANMTTLADVMALPFLPIPSGEVGSAVFWNLYQKYPSMQKQFADNKVLITWTSAPYFLITKTKQVKTIDDIKGLKIRTTGGPPTEMMKALGGVPTPMGMPDVYLNIEKGVIDGALVPWEPIISFKFYEVVKYYTYAPFHVTYFTQAFSTKKWDSLSADIKTQISSVSGLNGSKFWGKNMFDTAEQDVRAIVKEKKYDMFEYTPSADEMANWRKTGGEPLWEVWVKAREAEGYKEARDILNDAVNMLKSAAK
jgi:TRAP-type C4-dicarboxylate transport system substrate-binding protein